MDAKRYDVVIVGGGAAGCVLAARLSEDRGRSVLLLEAGPDYGPDPAGWPDDLRDPSGIKPDSHPWGYLNASPSAGQPFSLPRAKVLGGSTTINGCIWLRGSRSDYDGWATALGDPGWGFDELLPVFRRVEADPLGPSALHGADGPVPVARTTWSALSPVDRAFVDAASALGFPPIDDLNGTEAQHPGVGLTPANVAAGVRMNGAFTYLAAARDRFNLRIVPDVLVDRVLIEGGRATGVVAADGRTFAAGEVVLCAGVYGSPAILLRSGIGPAGHLREIGVPVVTDRPGVGEHLLDHPNVPSWLLRRVVRPELAPAATAFVPVIVRARSRGCDEEIDLHLYPIQWFDETQGAWVFEIAVILQHARSQGRVRLTSLDPTATLDIDHAYFADPADLESLCDGAELAFRLLATPPLADALVPATEGAPTWRTRDELRDFVRANVGTTYHPSSTCRMAPASDPLAVVDQQGRVYGVDGLRIADAAIFSSGPRCNIHFPVLAVAEKIADLINGSNRGV